MTESVSEAQLHAFFDGQLDDAEEREVLAYLNAHPEVLRRFREHDTHRYELADGLGELADDRIDPGTEALASRLTDRLKKREQQKRWRRWFGFSSATLALLALGWVGHTAWIGSRASNLPPLLADAARDHEIFSRAQKPVEIPGTDEHLMLQIFASHLGEEVRIPNLSDYGYQLIGGRLLGAAEGPFVQLLYDDGADHPLTLYVAKQQLAERDLRLFEVEGRGVGYWGQQALAYALVADAPMRDIEPIVTELAAAN